MKLLREQIHEIQVISEADKSDPTKKRLFIEGIFLQGDIKNRNGRIYPAPILEKEVGRYMRESVQRGNAYGELDHPVGPKINPDRISHRITELYKDGSNYIGKAQVSSTPMGQIVRNLLEDGGTLAVSSRGVGSLRQVGGAMQVAEDFQLSTAADVVINPSAPDAYIQAILEAPEWVFDKATGEWRMLEMVVEEAAQVKASQISENQMLDLWARFVDSVIVAKT